MGSEVSKSLNPDTDFAKCLDPDSVNLEPKHRPLQQPSHKYTLPITASVTTLLPFAIVPLSLLLFTYVLSHWTKLSTIKSVLHSQVDKRFIFRISQFSKLTFTNITLSYVYTVLCATFMSRSLVSFYTSILMFSGYGFCEFKDQETALSAMRNLNGFEIAGRTLRVDNGKFVNGFQELVQ